MNVNSVLRDPDVVVFTEDDVRHVQMLVRNYFLPQRDIRVTDNVVQDLLDQLLKMCRPPVGDIYTRYTLQDVPPGGDFRYNLVGEAVNTIITQIESEDVTRSEFDAFKAQNEKNTLGKIKLNRRRPKTTFYWKY
jgi:hypothetical protein